MKKFLLAAIVLFAGAAQSMAQSYDLILEDANGAPGTTVGMMVMGQGSENLAYGFQFDLVLPEGFTTSKAIRGALLKDVDESEEYYYAIGGGAQSDGSFRTLVYFNPSEGVTAIAAEGQLLKLNVKVPADADGTYDVTMKNIEVSSTDGKKYQTYTEYTAKLTISDPTGINTLNSASAVKDVYTVAGAQQNAAQRGLNIVRKQDGTVKKVMVK